LIGHHPHYPRDGQPHCIREVTIAITHLRERMVVLHVKLDAFGYGQTTPARDAVSGPHFVNVLRSIVRQPCA
jgi:hypothetical protein